MEKLEKVLEERLAKAKYIKRTGGPGNYKYQYKEEARRGKQKTKDKRTLKEGMAGEVKAEVRARMLNGLINKNDTGDNKRVIPIDGKLYYGNIKQSKTYNKIKDEIKSKIKGKEGKIPEEWKSIIGRVQEGGEADAGITKTGNIMIEIPGTGNEWYLSRIVPKPDGKYLYETYSTQEENVETVDRQEEMVLNPKETTKKTFSKVMTEKEALKRFKEDAYEDEEL